MTGVNFDGSTARYLFFWDRICRKLWFIYVYLVSECVMLSPKFSGLEWFRFNLRTFRWFPVVSCSFSQLYHLGTITQISSRLVFKSAPPEQPTHGALGAQRIRRRVTEKNGGTWDRTWLNPDEATRPGVPYVVSGDQWGEPSQSPFLWDFRCSYV